jgi:hypothetical protein
MRFFVLSIFAGILVSLFSALRFMLKVPKPGDDRRQMVKALTWRVGLSLMLFVLLWVAYALGWIHPTGFARGE